MTKKLSDTAINEANIIFLLFPQKNKGQSAYNGIRYNKLETPETAKNKKEQSPAGTKITKLLLAADDIDPSQDQQAYEYEEEGDDDNEETRFITRNRSSFYTSSERT